MLKIFMRKYTVVEDPVALLTQISSALEKTQQDLKHVQGDGWLWDHSLTR